MKTRPVAPTPKRIPRHLWEQLSTLDKIHIWIRLIHLYLSTLNRSVPFPIHFTGQVSLLVFFLLFLMPVHPLAIPATLGGALSIALLPAMLGPFFQKGIKYLKSAGAYSCSYRTGDKLNANQR